MLPTVFQVHAAAVESNANRVKPDVVTKAGRFAIDHIPKRGDLTAWMDEIQETAEADLVRYEMERGNRNDGSYSEFESR